MYPRITEYRKQYVRDNYGKLSSDKIAKEMNCSSAAIRGLARRLGVSTGYISRPWKTTEVTYMREFYPILGYKICKVLNRTTDSIGYCVRKWGIKKDRSRPHNWINLVHANIPNGLTAIEFLGYRDGHVHAKWLLKCHCGNLMTSTATRILNGESKSCGCLNFHRSPGPYFDKNRLHERWRNTIIS